MESVQFTEMKNGTKEEYQFLNKLEDQYIKKLPERIIKQLLTLKTSLPGYQITRLEHSLQTATRATNDKESDEMVVGALLHDIGDSLSPYNHEEFAAAIIKPFVSEKVTWIVGHHGIFQKYYYAHHLGGNRNERDEYKSHPWYEETVKFCERWDQTSFDPDFKSLPIDYFEPLIKKIFTKKT